MQRHYSPCWRNGQVSQYFSQYCVFEHTFPFTPQELHKNEFKNVTLILRAIEQVISKDTDCIHRLVNQGVVVKISKDLYFWFSVQHSFYNGHSKVCGE